MLTDEQFHIWSREVALSADALDTIAAIRASPPSRAVRAAAGNAPTRYVSAKMGWVVATESRTVELPFARAADDDDDVLEYYDQPPPIWLRYLSPTGRPLPAISHTPDFFVLRRHRAEWVECKGEDDLVRLAAHNPHRYSRADEGHWRCEPGERYAARLGLGYRVFSSAEIDWMYQRNLIFLESYRRGRRELAAEALACVDEIVRAVPGLLLTELLRRARRATADDIYGLIAARHLHVDLRQAPLAEPERVRVFRDAAMARAMATMPAWLDPAPGAPPGVWLGVGAVIDWDGAAWTIVNRGDHAIALLGDAGVTLSVPRPDIEALVAQGHIQGRAAPRHGGHAAEYAAGHEAEATALLAAASPAALDAATRRSRVVLAHVQGEVLPGDTTPTRTRYAWVARWRRARDRYGARFAFVGLLPHVQRCGNRTPRLRPEVRALTEEFIATRYESLQGGSMRAVWAALERICTQQGLTAPSYKSFRAMVRRRPRHEQERKRRGPRAAYAHEPFYYELTFSTPRHGDRPWEIGHIDHSPADVELLCSQTGQNLGTCWITFLVDAFSRRILALTVAFQAPSALSCLLVLRECVRRHNRLPETVVVDGGPEFHSTYFETLLARYEVHQRTRPGGKPRHGAVCERLFGTTMTQLIHTLRGNTAVRRHVRGVTKGVDPARQACWTLGALYAHLCGWAYEVYDTIDHPALGQSPRAAYAQGLVRGGPREHLLIPYDEDFIVQTFVDPLRRGFHRADVTYDAAGDRAGASLARRQNPQHLLLDQR